MIGSPEDCLIRAAEYWRTNDALSAGRLIFESLSKADRPFWAANVLKFVGLRLKITSEPMTLILKLATRSQGWDRAHYVFDDVRDEILGLEELPNRTVEQELQLALLGLGEVVAKVLYNSTDPQDEFDDDSGWWVTVLAKNIAGQVGLADFSGDLWQELIRQPSQSAV